MTLVHLLQHLPYPLLEYDHVLEWEGVQPLVTLATGGDHVTPEVVGQQRSQAIGVHVVEFAQCLHCSHAEHAQ